MSSLKRPFFRLMVTSGMIFLHLAAVTRPYAATVNWTAGSGSNFNWADAANWNSGIPSSLDDVLFPFAVPNPNNLLVDPQILTLGSGSLANSLGTLGDYVLSSGDLELTSGSIRVGYGHSLSLGSKLMGANGLTLTGGGMLRLTDVLNAYTGVTTVANGTLVISDPAQLGADTSAVMVTGSASRGFGGGSLLLEGGYDSGMNFTRDLTIQGYGPITDRGFALVSVGTNTISGDIQYGAGNVATGIHSSGGLLTISGDLSAQGTGQIRFGAVNAAGVGGYLFTGAITSAGNLEKLGGGTLILDPSDASGFSGNILINAGSLRVANGSALSTSTANGALTLGGGAGTLEIRTDAASSFSSRRVTMGTSSNAVLFLDHAVGGDAVNATVLLAPLILTAGSTTRTLSINGRNGYGVTFAGNSVGGSLGGNNTISINANGLTTFQGDFWNNTNTTARTLSMAVTTGAQALITGDLIASGSAHILTKSGAGILTILGGDSTYSGATNISGGTLAISHFGSINNNTEVVNIGSTTTPGTLTIMGNNLNPAQTTTNKVFNLAGTTATVTISADQTLNSSGLILNADFTATGAGIKSLTLGGNSHASIENEIRGAIVDHNVSNVTSLYKTGSGTWMLSGANTYTGATLINNGILKIQDTFSGTSRNVLADDAILGLGFAQAHPTVGSAGGTFHYSGAPGENSTESIGNLMSASGSGTVKVTAGDAGTASLNIASFNEVPASVTLSTALSSTGSTTMTVSSTAGLVPGMKLIGGTGSATYILSITNGTQMVLSATQTSLAAGTVLNFERITGSSSVNFAPDANSTISLGGIAAVGLLNGYSYFNGSNFAYAPNVGNAILRAPIYGTDDGFVNADGALVADSHNVVTESLATAAAMSLKSLKMDGSNDAEISLAGLLTINMDGAGTSGGILATGGSNTISGTGVTSGGAAELVIRVDGSSDVLYLNAPVTSSTTGGLTKTGAGTLVIGAANSHTTAGATHLLEGTIQLAAGGRLSANSVNLFMRQGTVLDMNGVNIAQSSTSSSIGLLNGTGRVTNTSGDPVVFAMAGSGGVFNGSIDEVSGQISVVKMGTSASQTLTGISNYTGSTTVGVPGNGTTGNLAVSYLANIGEASSIGRGDATDIASNAASLIFGGTTGGLVYSGTESVRTDRLFTLAGTVSGSGVTITNNGVNNAALVFSNTNPIAFTGTTNQLLRLSGSSLSDNWFYPQINNSAPGITSFTKVGTGLWILGNENNGYTGLTTIGDGMLQAQDGSSLPAASGLVLGGSTTTTNVFQSRGEFTRNLTTVANAGANTVSWATTLTTGGAGFAGSTDKLVVAIGGLLSPTTLVWNQDGFVKTGASLVLNSTTALSEVEIRNPIDLNGATRTIIVNENTSTFTDYATITGIISNGTGSAGLTKTGNGTLQLLGSNTYNGVTSFTAGTLVVNSLGNSANPGGSSVGSSAAAHTAGSALTLGNGGTTAAILQYIGAGETSDRMIRLNTTTGSTQIHSDGSGPLILTNVVNDMASGVKALYLRGSNAMGNMVTSNLEDNGGTLSLIIDSGASWILSGNNSYSGNTTLSAGALGIGNDSAFGSGTLILSNGSLFAYGEDRVITNAVSQSNNSGPAFVGDYSLAITGDYALLATTSNPTTTTNNIVSGKSLTLGNVTADSITAARTWTLNGAGSTFINGDISTTTAFPLHLSYTGNGLLTLGGANTTGGNTTLNNANGTMRLVGAAQLGSGNLTVNSGTLLIESVNQSVATLTMGGVANTSAVIDVATGLTLAPSAITFTGTTTLASSITGLGTLDLGNAGITVNVADNINQDVDMAWTIANLIGSGTFTKIGNGTLDVSGVTNNNFTGFYQVDAGAILGLEALDNNLVLNGGVYLTTGTFTRALGTGDNQVQWLALGGGFAAQGGDLTVTLSGVADPLVWGGTTYFVPDAAPLIFGATTADSIVDFTHNIDLNNAVRTVTVVDNTAVTTDKAVLSGVLSSSGGITKTGNGTLQLTGANTFTGGITVTAGALQFSTVSDNGGVASNLGQGSDGLTLSGGRLQFVGNTNQSTNRAIALTTTGILDASGTDNATITFAGAITAGGSTLNLDGSGYGILTGLVSQTGTAADINKVGSGTWRMDVAQTIADDLFVSDGLLILNAINAHTGDDLFIRSGTLRLAVNGALSKDMDDLQISGETSGGGVLDIYGTTGSSATDIIVGRLSPNPQTVSDLTGTMIDSIGGGSFSSTTLNVRNGSVSANVTTIGATTLGGTVSADHGGLYSSSGSITGDLNLNTGASLVLYSGDISGNITFASGVAIAKHSPNMVTLSGSNTVAGAGITTINNGVLRLDFSSNTDAKIGNGGLTLNGGVLRIDGHASSAINVAAGNLILGTTSDPAPAVVTINTAGASTTLQVGTITRNLGGTLRFNPSSADAHFTTTASNGAGDILGGWATYQLGSGSLQFATISGGEIIGFASTVMNDIGTWSAGADVTESTGFTGALAGSISINSLRFDAAAGLATISVGTDDILDIASGGILITDNVSAGSLTITGGIITSSNANELIVTHEGAAPLILESRVNGNMGLTKAGSGVMVLNSATNTSNGILRLSGGTLRLQGGGAVGDYGAVILEPVAGVLLDVVDSEVIGSLSGGSSTNYKGMAINIADTKSLTINQTASQSYFGNISVTSGSATLSKIGAGTLTITDGLVDLGTGGVLNIIGGRLALDINGNNNQLTQLASGMSVNISNGGSLFVDHNSITLISGTQGRIADNVALTFNSAGSTTDSLFFRHDQNASNTELIGNVTFGSGVNSIRVDATSTTSALAVLRAATVSRENQATMVLRGIGTQNTSNPRGQFQSGGVFAGAYGSGTTISQPVIPWAIGSSTGGTAASDTFLTTSGAANAVWRPLNLTTEYANVNDSGTWSATTDSQNVLVNTTTIGAAGAKAIRSLLVATGTGTVDLTGDGTGALMVESGGFLFSGTGSSTVSGFTGIDVSGTVGEYVFHVMGDTITVNSPLTTPGAKLTKSGPGLLVLTADNSAVSGLAINEGVLQITDLDNIGGNTGDLLFAGGTLRLDTAYSGDDLSTRNLTMLSGGGTLDTGGHDLSFANSIGNNGTGGFTKAGNGILTLNAAVNYSGGTTVSGGTLQYGLADALPSTSEVTLAGGTLDLGSHSTTLGGITMTGNGTLNVETDLTVNGTLLNVGGTRTLNFIGGGTTTINGDVQLANTTTSRTLIMSVQDGGTVIVKGAVINGTASASALQKMGDGLLELTSRNAYHGTTTIGNSTTPGGTLKLSGDATLSPGNLTLNNGILLLHSNISNQPVATLAMGGGPVGASSLLDIGSGITLSPTAITYSSTNNNETAVIEGDGTLNLGTSGITVTVNNSAAVDVDMSWEMDTVIGSGLFTKAGSGTLDIRGVTNYNFTGSYQINAGAILGLDGLTNNLVLNGGVFEGSGTFTRSLGIGDNQVQWVGTGGGGFSARDGALTVTLSGAPDPLVWGSTPFFVAAGAPLIFGSTTADNVVDFTHNIDLNGATRTLQVVDNVAVTTDRAVLSGSISNGSITKTGNGLLELRGNNTFSGPITINGTGGAVGFSSVDNLGGSSTAISLQAGFLSFLGSSDLIVDNAITLNPGTASQTIGLQNLGANGTNGAVVTFAGAINTAANILTLTGEGTGIITGGIVQTGTAADVYITSGNWTLRGTNVLGDDLVVQGPTSVLNLDGTGIITHNTGTSSGLYSRNGAIINLLADNPFVEPGGLDFIILGDSGGTVAGTLNLNTFNLTTPRLDVGQVAADLSGTILGSGTLTVNTAINLYRGSVEADLAGAGSAVKNGQGEVLFSGDNSSLTGATTVINGSLRLDYTDHNTRKIGAGVLNMYGGTLILEGSATADTAETVTSLNVGGGAGANTGASTIDVRSGTGQNIVLNLGAITRTTIGGTVNFATSSANATISTSAVNPGFLTSLGGWATFNDSSFATISGGQVISLISTAKDDVSTWLAGDNVTDAAGYTGTLGSDSVNSIIFDAAGGSSLAIASGARFTITSGGILVTENAGVGSITGGVIASGLPVGASNSLTELVVHQHSVNDFTLTSSLNGTLGLTKSGEGTLVVDGHNLYVGQTSVNEGTLSIRGGNAIGDRSIVNVKNRPGAILELDDSTETIAALTGGGVDGGIVNIGNGTLHLANNSALTTVYIGVLEGSGTFIKSGLNTQELEGNNLNFTGDVIVNRGLLHLDSGAGAFSAAARITLNGGELLNDQDQSGSRDRIGNSTVVTLNNTAGTRGLWIRTQSQNAARADTVGSVILGAGHNVIQSTNDAGASGSSQVATLTISNFSREGHATALLRGQNLGGGSGSRGRITAPALPAGSIGGGGAAGSTTVTIVPYLIGAAGLASNMSDANVALELGNSFVTWVSSGEGFRPLNLSTEYVLNADGYNALSGVTSNNVRLAANPGAALTGGSKTINSLLLDSSAGALTVTGDGADTLTLASGALLATTTTPANGLLIDGFSNLLTTSDEYLLYVTHASSTLTIASALSSQAALTKAGAGTLVLSGLNTYSGGTWFNQGLIEVPELDRLGSGSLNFNGGGLRWAAGSTFDPTTRALTLGLGGGIFDTNGNDVVFGNAFGGGGEGGLTKNGTGILILNAAGDFTGPTSINAGTLSYGVEGALPSTTDVTLAGGTLDVGAFNTTLGALDITVNSTITGSADVTFNGNVNQSTGSRTLTVTNTGTTTFNGDILAITNASTTARTLTLSVGTDTTLVVNNQITDGSGPGSLTKTGNGLLILNAANFHTGANTISAGSLLVNNVNGSGTGSGAVTLASGATLGGIGVISGAVTGTGVISPGSVDINGLSTLGQLTVGTITANTGSELFLQIGGASVIDPAAIALYQANPGGFVVPDSWTSSYEGGTTQHDQLLVTGSGAPTVNAVITISETYLNGYTPGYGDVFQFMDWASLGTNNLAGTQTFNLPALSGGALNWDTSLFVSHGVLFVTPEPSRLLLMFLGLLSLFYRRRR